jgi:alpha-glucan,water dikinase
MSHSIFHQTLLCQTQSVAEHQSKINSRGVTTNTLFQSQSVDKEKKLLLSTNFRGNKLFIRKRKVVMGRNQAIPRAVLTSNAGSQVCS